MNIKPKVFGIGFHKTGTTTLNEVLSILGYKVLSVRTDLASTLREGNIEEVMSIVDAFDAVEDNPWPILYRELDKRFPGSKFILTIRDEDRWINSVVNHFGNEKTEMRDWIYGHASPKGHEEIYLKRYQIHNEQVLEYFSSVRSNDLLVVNWEEGAGWTKICNFLNVPIPELPFPHANKGNYTKKWWKLWR